MAVSRNWEGIADPSMSYGEKGPILLGHSKGLFVQKLPPTCPKPLRGGGFKRTVSASFEGVFGAFRAFKVWDLGLELINSKDAGAPT